MTSYTITEPQPTVPKNGYTYSGRGGAGNFFRAPQKTSPAGVPTPAVTAPPSSASQRFHSGRGGAGNVHSAAERQALSFDEEIQRAEVRERTATLTHVGRGGAGNVFSTAAPTETTRRDSASTTGSTRSGFWHRLSTGGSNKPADLST